MKSKTTDIQQINDSFFRKIFDSPEKPRLIIPMVFYHGEEKWNVTRTFADQFKVPEEIKPYLLDYRYLLFDTNSGIDLFA